MNGKPQSDRSGQKSTHVQTLKRLRGGPKSSCQAISSPGSFWLLVTGMVARKQVVSQE